MDGGILLLHESRDPAKSAASPDPNNNSIKRSLQLFINFRRSGLFMEFWVGWIFKLECSEGIRNGACEFFCLFYCALHSLSVWCAIHFGAEGPHHLNFFFRELLGNTNNHPVTLVNTHQRQSYAGVPCCGLNYGATLLQTALSFRALNHPNGRAVFHAPSGIEVLKFRKDLCSAFWCHPMKVKHGSASHQFGDVLSNGEMRHSKRFRVTRSFGGT